MLVLLLTCLLVVSVLVKVLMRTTSQVACVFVRATSKAVDVLANAKLTEKALQSSSLEVFARHCTRPYRALSGAPQLTALSEGPRPTLILHGLLAKKMSDNMSSFIRELCRRRHSALDVNVYVIVPTLSVADNTLDHSCIHFIQEDERMTSALRNRIPRFGYLRDSLRRELIQRRVVKSGDVVGVMDFDFKRFMEVERVLEMARIVHENDALVLCSNGFEMAANGDKVRFAGAKPALLLAR